MLQRVPSLPRYCCWLLPAALALLPLPATAWLQLRPPASPTAPVALLFPPWWSGTRAVLAAGAAGAVIRFGAWPGIVIIAPYAGGLPPTATGAWAVLDPRVLGGCGATSGAAHDP
jgi:hypothetical protein